MQTTPQGNARPSNGRSSSARYDVIVIGGGAAGLSGAVALARSRRSVAVIDDGRPRNAPADAIHNYLGREGTPPADLLAIGRDELTGYGGEVITGTTTVVRPDQPSGFLVELADGSRLRARRLLITTGLVDELPPLPGIAELWGSTVLHCPYCHGWEVRDRRIGILATGPMASHQALMFRQLSDQVVLFRHTAELSDDQLEQLAARDIMVIDGEVAALDSNDGRLVGVRLASGAVHPCDALAIGTRLEARADFLAPLGLRTEPLEVPGADGGRTTIGRRIVADAKGATGVPGVWAAGNVTDPMAQVIVSAAAGMTAGAVINADLITEETAAAVVELRARREADHLAREPFSAEAERRNWARLSHNAGAGIG